MSKKMAGIIMAYGGVLAGLGLVLQSVAPELARLPSLICLGGGGLCALWGLVALTGFKRRVGIILTLVAVALVVLSSTLRAWLDWFEKSGAPALPLLLTLTLLLTVIMLMYVMHGERPPEFYEKQSPRREAPASEANRPAPPAR